MQDQLSYEDVLALAKTLSSEQLAKLICALSQFLSEHGSKWEDLKDIGDIRDYIEWVRFRDSYHPDGRRKSPQEFLLELQEAE